MTLTKKDIQRLGEQSFMIITKAQEAEILRRFSEEPYPYEWSEQDIAEQIRKIIRDF